jgi:soluble lytic murein transglycosylase-like protein
MVAKIYQAALASAKSLANQSGNGVALIHRTLRGLLTTAQHTLMLFGLGSLILIGLVYTNPQTLSRLQASINRISQAPIAATAPTTTSGIAANTANTATQPQRFAQVEIGITDRAGSNSANIGHGKPAPLAASIAIPVAMSASSGSASEIEQRNVSTWLSKRYRVATEATHSVVTTAYQTAHEIEFDPLLILAVVAIESNFNPIAESPMGAQGLMQVMSKVHQARFKSHGGIKEALNPVANIKVGSLILKDYVVRGGSMEAGLKSYVGAGGFASENAYGSRVMAEYQRLKQVVASSREQNNALDANRILPVARQGDTADEAKAIEKDGVVAL